LGTRVGVVDAVSGSEIDSEFPDSIVEELVVTEVPLLHSIDPADKGGSCLDVAQVIPPLRENVSVSGSEVVPDFVHNYDLRL
jgi:hypothetical protein